MNSSLVYLVQTDTTVGFLSLDDEKLTKLKQREKPKKMLANLNSFKSLNSFTRVPKKFRKLVRNSKKTTFIYPNLKSFRVVDKTSRFYDFIDKFDILYSTSANKTACSFKYDFAFKNADVIVENSSGFFETIASKIYSLKKQKFKKIR